MGHCNLSADELRRRSGIAAQTRAMVSSELSVKEWDETSLMTEYKGYFLQISFSQLHPLMVICLAKVIETPVSYRQYQIINELNLNSVIGSHAINEDVGCYSYRASNWLEEKPEASGFFEFLERCVDEADRGFDKITG